MARLLFVDEDPRSQALKGAILTSAGYHVAFASSAREAVDKLRHDAFDVVLTDWRLGDSTGRAVIEAVRAHSAAPVVVVSGYLEEALAASPPADFYLEKPVAAEELVTIVEELLKSRAAALRH